MWLPLRVCENLLNLHAQVSKISTDLLGSTGLSFSDTVQQLERSRIQIKQVCKKTPEEKEEKRGLVKAKSKSKSKKREKGRRETERVKENQRRSKEN